MEHTRSIARLAGSLSLRSVRGDDVSLLDGEAGKDAISHLNIAVLDVNGSVELPDGCVFRVDHHDSRKTDEIAAAIMGRSVRYCQRQDRLRPRMNHDLLSTESRASTSEVAIRQPVMSIATRKVVDNQSTGVLEGAAAWPTGC